MSFVLADTGPLYALVDPDDGLHERSRSELARLDGDGLGIVVLDTTLMEAYTLVLHRLGVRVAHRWLDEMEAGAGRLQAIAEDTDAAREHVRRYADQPITLFDAVLAEVSSRLGVAVWTFDHHFDVLSADVWR